MGFPIRYLVPYIVRVHGSDTQSKKSLSTAFYLKTGAQTGAPPAYGAPIAGTGDTGTLLNNFVILFEAFVAAVGSITWQLDFYDMRAILGYGYASPFLNIIAIGTGGTTSINTATPHGLSNGNYVSIVGVSSPASINGIWQVLSVSGPTTFLIAQATTGTFIGPATVQKVVGNQTFIVADAEFASTTATGGVSGDAMPLFVECSIRRINPFTGKSFRSHFNVAPLPETMCADGKLSTLGISTFGTACAAFNAVVANGGSDSSSGNSFHSVLSRKLATQQISPFTSSINFVANVTAFEAHEVLTSLKKRKPKLGSTVTP